jgi:hypothetical protein
MKVLIRDDDLGYNDSCLNVFLEAFKVHNMKLNMEAIPARCYQNKELIKTLKPFLETGLFEIHQHGVTHLEHEECNEFPSSREVETVKKDLLLGKKILTEMFGDKYYNIITLPWHNSSEEHIKSMQEIYKAISPIDIPINMDMRIRDEEGPRWKTSEELIEEFEFLEKNGLDTIVIITHHYLYNKNEAKLIDLELFLRYLENRNIHTIKFSELK